MALLKGEKAKQVIDRDALIAAVDEVITAYVDGPSKDHNPSVPKPKGRMLSEHSTIVDLNVNMKDTALCSILRTLTEHTYPHPAAVKWVINDVFLMKGDPRNVGLASEIFSRLSLYHPVATDPNYYKGLLEGCFAIVKKDVVSDVPFFWFILEELKQMSTTSYYLQTQDRYKTDLSSSVEEDSKKNNPTYYCDLDTGAKQERLLMCLKIISSWLEDDFNAWKSENNNNRRSLFGQLIWPKGENEGEMTGTVHKLLTLWDRPAYFQRLLPLLAELTQRRDRIGVQMYPFLGINSKDLARELAAKLLPTFKENGSRECDKHLWGLLPAWLRLATTSYMLTELTSFQSLPEISCAITILQHLEHKFRVGRREVQKRGKIAAEPPNPQLVAKFAKLKSVNLFYQNGMTRLFKACKENRADHVNALLSFPLLDLNLTDWMGRTPLLEACKRGSLQCVKALLQYSPGVGSTQRRVSTRTADEGGYTPLMVAAEAGHTDICQLLLQHSGSVLLDDLVNENNTALDLCTCEETRALLQKYKDKRVETMYSQTELIMATGDMLLVATLCVVLIHSYLEVHRTWDIYHLLKRNAKQAVQPTPKRPTVLVEYSRYHRDFRTHLNSARVLTMKLKKISQLSSVTDLLLTFVSMNK